MLSLEVESWIWYSFAVSLTLARITSRTLLFGGGLHGIKKLQLDDWLMLFALCTYTVVIVAVNITRDTRTNLIASDVDVSKFTQEDRDERRFGSKMVLVVEECQIATIWAIKACLLMMYYRLTIALKENLYVKILAAYVAFGFVSQQIFYLGVWCRPFHQYWAVPPKNKQCSAATNHLISNAVYNLSSDMLMLILALQMLIRSHLPFRRKLVLCLIFGLGVFVILCAVLNKYYSFTRPFGSLWTFWYVRESSTAVLVANLPYTWTLLRRIFHLSHFDTGRSSESSGLGHRDQFYSQASHGRQSPPDRRDRTFSPDDLDDDLEAQLEMIKTHSRRDRDAITDSDATKKSASPSGSRSPPTTGEPESSRSEDVGSSSDPWLSGTAILDKPVDPGTYSMPYGRQPSQD